ncbi:MAG: hypothetical protein Edafosvirus3_26 [Edafosvirus sp.]|uniref:Uncharacterized protein n=1 Tax=Edafosvirus sp. TaxID=2487765 RepID=A0A3G4ZST5_9VIRU|nr:MAG: hypothetical protein Edafosvirus3_26 [Edafosvirus sp.]
MLNKIISKDNELLILSFLSFEDLKIISKLNQYFYKSINKNGSHIIYKAFCGKYKLLTNKQHAHLKNNDYKKIIHEVISCCNSFGGHHDNVYYWENSSVTNSNIAKYTWFPLQNICRNIWWFEFKLKKKFNKSGIYQVWLRIFDNNHHINKGVGLNPISPFQFKYTGAQQKLSKEIQSDTFQIYGCGDIYLCTINIQNDGDDVLFELSHHKNENQQENEYHEGYGFSFMYFIPINNFEDELIPENIILDEENLKTI